MRAEAEAPRDEVRRDELDHRSFTLLVGIAALVAAIPMFATAIPPFLDYPNHLARIAVLRDLDGPLGLFFQANARLLPNLGMDALMFLLSLVLPLERAGQVAVAIVAVAFVTGFARLHRAVQGARTPWAIAGGLALYTLPLLYGFLNFVLGVALAMHVLASWLQSRPGWGRIAWGAIAGFVLLICHLLGLGFVVMFAPILDRVAGRSWKISLGSLVAFVPATLAYLLFSPRPAGGLTIMPSSPELKKIQATVTFITGYPKLDLLFVGLTFVAVIGLLVLGRARLQRSLLIPAAILLGLWLVLPFGVSGTANLDARFPALVVLFGLLALGSGRVSFTKGAAGILMGLLFLRSSTLAVSYNRAGAELAAVRSELARLPAGAVVVPIRHEDALVWDAFGWRPPLVYAPHLATLNGHYVAGTFDEPTQQPIRLREGWELIGEYRTTRDLPGALEQLRGDVARLARKPGEVWVFAIGPAPNGRSSWRLFPLADARR